MVAYIGIPQQANTLLVTAAYLSQALILCCAFGLCVIVIVNIRLQFVVTKVVEEEEVRIFFFFQIWGNTNAETGAPHNKRTAQSILKWEICNTA